MKWVKTRRPVERSGGKYYPEVVKPINAYIDICRACSEKRFRDRFDHAFLVHSALTQRALQPVKGTRHRMTIDRLVIETDQAPSAPEGSPLESLYRVFELRPAEGASRVSIGCGDECDVQINDRSISRLHACIDIKQERHLISDCNSSAGTLVNGREVRPGTSVQLSSSDSVVLGYLSVVFLQPVDFYRFVHRLFID